MNTNVYQRYSPKNGIHGAATLRDERGKVSPPTPCSRVPPIPSPLVENDPRKRHFSGCTSRPPSILSGIRGLISGRPRSESLGTQLMKKPLRKVQIQGCKLDSVYDLRESEQDGSASQDFYDDESAFRRPRSNSSDFLILRKTSRPLSVDVVGLVDSQSDPYRQYMKVVDCYELAPSTGNVIVLDKKLKIWRGFQALCDNGIGAGLVWDSEKSKMISIVTLSDFLVHLQQNDVSPNGEIESILSGNSLVRVSADSKIFNACEEFTLNRVHRLVVCDESTGDVLYMLTIKRVLQAIHKQNRSLHFAQWLTYCIRDTKIGKWGETIYSVKSTDPVSTAIRLMLGYRLSSLPVVDSEGKSFEVLHKADIAAALVKQENSKNFIETCMIGEILPERGDPVFATPFTPVAQVLDGLLTQKHARCIFILDNKHRPTACVSLSDIMHHLIYDESPFQKPSLTP